MIHALTCDYFVCQYFYFRGTQLFCIGLQFDYESDFRLIFVKSINWEMKDADNPILHI